MYTLDDFSRLHEKADSLGWSLQQFKDFFTANCGTEREFNALAHQWCNRQEACQNTRSLTDDTYEPIWEIARYDGHILLACRTGSGKTTTAQAAVKLAYCSDPQWVDFCIVDPKGSYFLGFEQDDSKYVFVDGVERIPEVVDRLEKQVKEMQRRQGLRRRNRGKHPDRLKRIVVLLDEFNNLLTYARLYDKKANAESEKGEAKSRCADQIIELVTLLINMGREDLINVWLFAQSHRVQQIGLDTSIQDNLAFFCQGRNGDFDSIEDAISDRYIVGNSKHRDTLHQQLKEFQESGASFQTPLVFSTLGGKKLRFLGDLQSVKDEQIYWGVSKSQQRQLMPSQPIATIDPDCERIIEFSVRRGWVSASQVKAGVRSFRDSSTADIRAKFYQLMRSGEGAIRGDGEAIEYNHNPQG